VYRSARGQRLGLQYVVQKREPGYVLSTLSHLTSQSIVEIGDIRRAVETGYGEPAIQSARVPDSVPTAR
jgi:hypothetical protein